MKMLRKIIGVVTLIVIVASIVIVMNMDRGIKVLVETLGPKMTQAPVTLHSAELSLMEGRGSLQGLQVSNPGGYSDAAAFSLDEISFTLDKNSLKTDTIIVKSLNIQAPRIRIESAGGTTNLQVLQDNIEQFLRSESSDSSAPSGQGQNIIIEALRISGGTVSYSATQLLDEQLEMDIPTIEMTDVGADEGGISASQVAAKVAAVLSAEAAMAVGQAVLKYKNNGKNLEDQLKEKFKRKTVDKLKGLLGVED